MTMMAQLRGVAFDPVVLDAFFEIEDEITRIVADFRDEDDTARSVDVAAAVAGGGFAVDATGVATARIEVDCQRG